jgi:hypothetical protein
MNMSEDRREVWIRDDGVVFMPHGDTPPAGMRRGWLMADGTVRHADVLRSTPPHLGEKTVAPKRGAGSAKKDPTPMPSEAEVEQRINEEVERRLAEVMLRENLSKSVAPKKATPKKTASKKAAPKKAAPKKAAPPSNDSAEFPEL